VALADADPATGPLASLPTLAVKSRTTLGVPLNGTPTDLAYNAATNRFLVTTSDAGIYVTNGALTALDRYTVVDIGYSVDLGRFGGAAFLDKGQLIAVGENKSFVVLTPSDSATADANFRYFRESADKFDEVNRSRFGTVRARMFYILSAAYDPASNSIYTITVPNNVAKRMVVSRFDRKDFTLSEEFVPALDKNAGLALGADRSLGEYMISGATIVGGQLFAISASHSTLLTLDLATHRIVAAYTIGGLTRPVGIAAKGDDLFILGDDLSVTVVGRPAAPAAAIPSDSTRVP
jgi:disulfide bond formation protein DsbB